MTILWVNPGKLEVFLNKWFFRHFKMVLTSKKQYEFMEELAKTGLCIYNEKQSQVLPKKKPKRLK